MLLTAENISKNYGLKQILTNVSLYLNSGDKIGILGVNGTGKSTLLRILAGTEEADSGDVKRNNNVQISYLPQNPDMRQDFTVLEQVFAALPKEYREIHEYEAKTMLTKLGITDFTQTVGTLSGGQRKRTALAAALIHPADVLILDEPTNHLDIDMINWLEGYLKHFTGGLIMVTHDRYFLNRVVNRITELDRGTFYSYEANYAKYLALKSERAEMERASERKRQAVLRTEYQWIMRGARARSTKSKDRIERYEALKQQSGPEAEEKIQISAFSERLGRKIIELKDISKSFGTEKVLDNFSYSVLRDDRIGIVGRNGIGKTTLLNIISGRLAPDTGHMEMGATVKVGYFTQEAGELDPDRKVIDYIKEIAPEIKTPDGNFTAAKMLERFLFSGETQHALIGKLSGGERRRLFLLGILMDSPNVLLLDEPTNDLDIETLTILEDYLQTFQGPVIAVSHDRYFLDKIANAIFAVEEGGKIQRYTGNYSDYETMRPAAAEKTEAVEKASERGKQPPRQKKLKFTYKEEREFETINDVIADLEAELARCDQEMEEAAADYVRLNALTEERERISTELDGKMERWLYLTELAERIAREQN